MDFKEWVYQRGGPKEIAIRLKLSEHAVRRWLRQENAPRISVVKKLVKISGGDLTVESVIRDTTSFGETPSGRLSKKTYKANRAGVVK